MDNDDILRRLTLLEDREAIRQTWSECMFRIDIGLWDELEDVFTEDAVVSVTGWDKVFPGADRVREGREEVVRGHFVPTAPKDLTSDAKMAAWRTPHLTTNFEIEIDGDTASARSLLFQVVQNTTALMATYQLGFRRDPDRWRIADFKVAAIWFAQLKEAEVDGNETWWP